MMTAEQGYSAAYVLTKLPLDRLSNAFGDLLALMRARGFMINKKDVKLGLSVPGKRDRSPRLSEAAIQQLITALNSRGAIVSLAEGRAQLLSQLDVATSFGDPPPDYPDFDLLTGLNAHLTYAQHETREILKRWPEDWLHLFRLVEGRIGYLERMTPWQLAVPVPEIGGEVVSDPVSGRAFRLLGLYRSQRRIIPSIVWKPSGGVLLAPEFGGRLPERERSLCITDAAGNVFVPPDAITDDLIASLDTRWPESWRDWVEPKPANLWDGVSPLKVSE